MTTPIVDGSIEHLELTADGKTLLANLRKWEGSAGLLVWDVDKLIATATSPALAQALGRERLDTVNPNSLPNFKSFGWVYGVGTQKWDTTNLKSSYTNFCNANSAREEVSLPAHGSKRSSLSSAMEEKCLVLPVRRVFLCSIAVAAINASASCRP